MIIFAYTRNKKFKRKESRKIKSILSNDRIYLSIIEYEKYMFYYWSDGIFKLL